MTGRGGAAYLRLKRIKEKLKERSARPKRSDRGGGDQEDQEAEVARRQATLRNIEDGGVADYDDLPPLHINLKRTIGDLERWPGLIKDYSALTSYFLFCVVFMGLVVFQLDVPTQYEIDHMVRHRLLDQEGALAAITNHGDVFNYLLKDFDGDLGEFTDEDGGVFGTLFEAEYYNGDPIIGEDVGFLFSFNKLIGGVMLQQKRGTVQPCEQDRGFSSYNLFYETCYEDKVTDYGDTAEGIANSTFGDRELLDSTRYSATVGSSFKWDPEAKSYLAWLPLSDGSTLNKQRLQDLETLRWLDKNTRELEVKFIFYNGNFGRFTFAKITFTFDKGGIYRPYDPESGAVTQALLEGISVKVGSLNMEPYLKPIDFVRLALEVVFMVWVFSLTISIVREQLENFAAGKFMERVSAFTVFEFINLLCNIAFIVVRVLILQKITHGYVEVPVNDYKPIFEEVYQLTQSQLSINFISILLCIFRFFKYYQFQPRLQIVNKTMGAAVVHLYHFLLIFGIIFVGFAIIGNLNFGKQSRDFSSPGYSMEVLWESLFGSIDIGPTIGNTDLGYIDPLMGNIFFMSWMFVAFLVLFNIFIGILMDAYSLALEEGKAQAEKRGKSQPDAVGDDVLMFIRELSTYFNPKAWKYDRDTLLRSLKLIDAHKEDPPIEFEVYQKELEVLQKQREQIDHRIEYLEKMTSEDLAHEPFHEHWKHKTILLDEIAETLPGVKPSIGKDLLPEELELVWSHLLHTVDEEGETAVASSFHEDAHDDKILRDLVKNVIEDNKRIRKKLASLG